MEFQDFLHQQSAARMPGYVAGNAEHKSSWLTPVATALGAGVGFMIGGPAGAAEGASLGSSVGHVATGQASPSDALVLAGPVGSGAMHLAMPFNLGFADGGEVPDPNSPFRPLSADPAMLAALGVQPVPELSNRDRILQALGATLGSIDFGDFMKPSQKGYQKALTGLGVAAAKTFGNYENSKASEREKRIAENNRRISALNTADINDMLSRRRKAETDKAAEAKKREGWPVVPIQWAKAAGREDLAGQRVDPGTYRGLSDTYRAHQNASKPTPDRLSVDQRARLESNQRRFSLRLEQVKSKMERLQKQNEDPYTGDDPELTAKISQLADTLATIQDQWDAADAKVYGMSPPRSTGRAAPEPAAAPVAPAGPQVFQKDVRIQLPDGRTGTLKAGSPVPSGAKVIGG